MRIRISSGDLGCLLYTSRYGHFLQRIGNNVDFDKRVGINGIQLEPDGTLGVYVTRAYLNYSLDGKLNFRRKRCV